MELDFLNWNAGFFYPCGSGTLVPQHLFLLRLYLVGWLFWHPSVPCFYSRPPVQGAREKHPEKGSAPKDHANTAPKPTASDILGRYSLLKDTSEATLLPEKLHFVLKEERLYKYLDLILQQLADAIYTTDKRLSELLNLSLQPDFFELVNRNRTEAFKKRWFGDTLTNFFIF